MSPFLPEKAMTLQEDFFLLIIVIIGLHTEYGACGGLKGIEFVMVFSSDPFA